MKFFNPSFTPKASTRISSAMYSRNKSFYANHPQSNNIFTNNILSPIKPNKHHIIINNIKNYSTNNDSSIDNNIKTNQEKSKSTFSFKTKTKIKATFNNNNNTTNQIMKNKMRPLSTKSKTKWRFSDEPMWKKFLRGKLLYLLKKNIILCEKKFNPTSFTESISNIHVKEFKNKFKNLDSRTKVGIFTNKYPTILNQNNKFYSRYFDYFISPDELLFKNFTKEEIFQIKSDPVYFNLGGNFNNVDFFKKKTLKETLNEEEKIEPTKLIDITMKDSLKHTKKRIQKYMDYYTSVMSRKGLLY